MQNILFAAIAIILFTSPGYCQDTQGLLGQVANMYQNDGAAESNTIAGFTAAGLVGGIMFGCIGLGAFIYGKKVSEFRPMLIGFVLMAFPYVVKGTLAMYLIGIVLTAALFVWRE